MNTHVGQDSCRSTAGRASRVVGLAVALGALAAASPAMDRYADVRRGIEKGPKMQLVAATFFGGGGVEEFVGVAIAGDGRIVAVGNSWGPPFPEHPNTRVLGEDRLWNVPLFSVERRIRPARNRPGANPLALPSEDHPNRTGFLAFYSSDLTRLEQVVRLGWGSAGISAVRRMRDGSFVISGRANRPLDAVACPPGARRRQPLPADLPFAPYDFGGLTLSGDVYVAKLAPDLQGFAWLWTMEGFGDAPVRLYEGGNGETVFKARHTLWRIAADGSAFRDYRGTPLGEHGHRVRGISPADGRVVTGGSWLIGTGREPWKQPWMNVYDSDGNHIESYYWWSGPLAGHDDFRLVSDSGLEMVEPLPDGRYLLTGGSDGGNSVFCRHPADITVSPRHSGLPMSTWGAGVGHWSHFVSFNPYNLADVSYTLWSAFTTTGPASIYVHGLRGLNDGSLVVMGYASPYLVQTTHAWYHANTHYLYEGKPSRPVYGANGWPVFHGHGGHGNYVAVLDPTLSGLLWASAMANVDHSDAAACEGGLVVAGRCHRAVAFDGRTPAFMPYDIADWPGLIARLVSSGGQAGPSPARQVWQRLSAPLRGELAALKAGREPPEDLRERVLDEFDAILFDDRSFYDPAAWPGATFDAYETAIAERLRGGAVTDDELGYLNRALFEQGLPEHVFARPKHNLTPVVRAAQARHGGGASDGYLYFLRSPAGVRLDIATAPRRAAEPAAAVKDAAPAAKPAKSGAGSGSTKALGGTLEFPYAPAQRRAARLPGYCTSYAVLRSPGKLRPMFLHGWGETGAIKVTFGNKGGLDEEIRVQALGSGTLLLDGANTVLAGDWNRYAGGEWLKKKGADPLRVTIKALRAWEEVGGNMARLADASRGILTPEELANLAPRFRVKADMDLSTGSHLCALTNLACEVTLRDADGPWGMRIDVAAQVAPAQLGLTEEGTNSIVFRLRHEAFALPPKEHRAPKTIGDIDAMDVDFGGL